MQVRLGYSNRSVNTISFIISILIFIIMNFVYSSFQNVDFNNIFISKKEFQEQSKNYKQEENLIQNQIQETNKNNTNQEDKKMAEAILKQYNWQIDIPVISLHAEISEGTTQNIMSKYVGHFDDMSKTTGNIGLAAHNRGYENNYFQDIKKLQKGDEIIYKCEEFQMTYIVDTIEIISDTDWSYLEKTEENRITLITCVENEPEYRRCIQGIEKEIENESEKVKNEKIV